VDRAHALPRDLVHQFQPFLYPTLSLKYFPNLITKGSINHYLISITCHTLPRQGVVAALADSLTLLI
jgi:hypothetical protein